MTPQCQRLILNANGDPARFADTGLPVIPDDVPDFAGSARPALLAGLDWAAVHAPGGCPMSPACRATVRSCRAISLPRLHQARAASGQPLACARSGEWRHPVVGVWPVALRADLRHALTKEDLRKIELWTARHGVALADWPAAPVDPFFNVNTPEDAAAAERLAVQHPGI
jgi:molybdopterin-guanine dinucleotide biosynthesis protein A